MAIDMYRLSFSFHVEIFYHYLFTVVRGSLDSERIQRPACAIGRLGVQSFRELLC